MQRALIQFYRPENRELVMEALKKAGRQDLIGFGRDCLIPPREIRREKKDAPYASGKKPDARKESGRQPTRREERREKPPRHGGNPGRGKHRS